MSDVIARALVLVQSLPPPDEKPCHWFFFSRYIDGGLNFCPRCARRVTKHLRKLHGGDDGHDPDVDYDGGWCIEHDSTPHCHVCGVRLEGTLTDYAARELIDFYAADPSAAIGSIEAADLCVILDRARWYPERAKEIARIAEWVCATLAPEVDNG